MTHATEAGLTALPAVQVRGASVDGERIDPAAIEQELRRMRDDGDDAERSITRACMSNLIIYCDDQHSADAIPPELGTLVERHPARILLLVGEASSVAAGLAAEVSALCYLGTGGRQICAEHVRLAAAKGARRRLAPAARPLLIGDLPTALWWATPEPPPAGEIFQELSRMADQIVYDSVGWRDPARGVIAAADWSASSGTRRVSDLAWARLAPWRRLIAEAFDPARLPGGIEAIRDVEMEHGPHGLPQAWLLIGWLARCLGWRLTTGKMRPGVDIAWTFESQTGPVRVTVRRLPEGSPQIRDVKIRAVSPGLEMQATITLLDAARLALRIDGTMPSDNVVAMPPPSRALLLASQLSERSADPLFRDALATSRALARAVLT